MNQTYNPSTTPQTEAASVVRRIGAFLYDFLLLIAILFVATAIATVAVQHEIRGGNYFFQAYLLIVCFLFFGWFWTHGGQTLGMRAWKIRVENLDGSNISWTTALARFVTGLLTLPINLVWCLFDAQKRALHDQLTRTRVVMVEKGYVPPIRK